MVSPEMWVNGCLIEATRLTQPSLSLRVLVLPEIMEIRTTLVAEHYHLIRAVEPSVYGTARRDAKNYFLGISL